MGILNYLLGRKKFYRTTVSSKTEENIKREWENIKLLLNGKQPSQLRQALISADKSLDNALRDVVSGENMGDRLKNSIDKFDKSTYDKIWKAHKVRNSLVHEAGYEPPYYIITEAVEDLRKGLKVLGLNL